ncbi:unnamed protein product [Paramecium primaurelia]|uniref:Uncharacterized protein n=1 Tax=Paramecium primaurelia TaxID=5886 RepID=A0A8S1JY93_PARPR|nr:unnamed protein product [Paramecium primaurelia]
MSIKHQQIDEPLYILKGFKIPLLNTYFQEPYLSPINVKQQLSSRCNNQPFFESSSTKANATSREFFRFESQKVDKTQQNKQLYEKSLSPNKPKFLEDNKLKGLLNIVSDRNKQIHLKKYDFPIGGSTTNTKKIKFNFKKINIKIPQKIQFSKEDLENNKKFLINTLRKNSVIQNQVDIERPVRSKSDFEKARSKSNLKQVSPYKDLLIEEQQKKKTVRFNELVEIKMFDRIKSHLMKQLI